MDSEFSKNIISKWFKTSGLSFDDYPYNKVIAALRYKKFVKNEIILNIGEKETKIYFILTGCIRSFFLHNEKEFSLNFSFMGDVLSSFDSFMLNTNSTAGLHALEETEVYYLDRTDYFALKKEFVELEKIESDIFKLLYNEKIIREKQFIALSAKEKYEILFIRNKKIIKNIPVKYLSSYLGIEPNSLSRIKNEFFKKT